MNNINWRNFISLDYWLAGLNDDLLYTPVVRENSFFFWFFLYFFFALIFAGITLRVYQAFLPDTHPFQKKFPIWGNNLIYMGVIGQFWFLLRQIGAYFLGSRIFLIIFAIWGLIFVYLLVKYFLFNYKLEMIMYKASLKKSK